MKTLKTTIRYHLNLAQALDPSEVAALENALVTWNQSIEGVGLHPTDQRPVVDFSWVKTPHEDEVETFGNILEAIVTGFIYGMRQ